MDKDFSLLMEDLKEVSNRYFDRARNEDVDINLTAHILEKNLDETKGNIVIEIAVSYVLRQMKGEDEMKVMGQELTGTLGTPAQYAEAFKTMLKIGTDLDTLNKANHIGLENKQITMEHFQAAARVLAEEILKR